MLLYIVCVGVGAVTFLLYLLYLYFKLPQPRGVVAILRETRTISSIEVETLTFLPSKVRERLAIFLQPTAVATPRPRPRQTKGPLGRPPPPAVADDEFLLERRHYLIHQLPRNRSVETQIPKLIKINGKPHFLRPILAHDAGTFEYVRVNYDEIEVAGATRNLWYYDFLTTNELVGYINHVDGTRAEVRSPGPGHLIGFQVLTGTAVQEGDIIMLLAQRKEDSH